MNRADQLAALAEARPWDVLIIGGGATGCFTARDAAMRRQLVDALSEEGDLAPRRLHAGQRAQPISFARALICNWRGRMSNCCKR